MPKLNWRWLLALSSIPSFAVLFFVGFIPESPRYLCMKGRVTDARNVLQKIALLNKTDLPSGILICDRTTRIDEELSTAEEILLLSSTRNKTTYLKSGFSNFIMLFSSRLIRTTFLLWMLFFGNSFSYYGIVLLASELSSSQSKCGSTTLLSENFQDSTTLYSDVFITSLAGVSFWCPLIWDSASRTFLASWSCVYYPLTMCLIFLQSFLGFF